MLSHPVQYYSPWFRWLRAHTNLSFKVFYLWNFGVTAQRDPQFATTFRWDIDLLEGYDSTFVPNVAADPGTHHFRGLDNPQLTAELAAWRPDAVLMFGYNWLSHLRVLAWARRRGIPLLFRGDSHFLGRGTPGWTRRLPLSVLFRQFAALTYVGQANHDYFRALGVPEKRLFFAPHAVDGARFRPNDETALREASRLRDELGLQGKRVLLFAGKFSPNKQPVELLRAFLDVAVPNTALVFVGDGAEKTAMEKLASEHPGATVRFLPFANQSEMPSRYLLGDVFVLPSRGFYETWGLAVNEAMHMGRPCLVSDLVGCQRDLVTDGATGWVFRADDAAHLRAKLAEALRTDPAAFRPAIAARMAMYSYRDASAGLQHALSFVVTSPPSI